MIPRHSRALQEQETILQARECGTLSISDRLPLFGEEGDWKEARNSLLWASLAQLGAEAGQLCRLGYCTHKLTSQGLLASLLCFGASLRACFHRDLLATPPLQNSMWWQCIRAPLASGWPLGNHRESNWSFYFCFFYTIGLGLFHWSSWIDQPKPPTSDISMNHCHDQWCLWLCELVC